MGLGELEAKLRSDAKREIAEIRKRAKSEASGILEQLEAEAEAESEKLMASGLASAKLKYNQVVSDASITSKKKLAQKKQELLVRLFKEAEKEIASLKPAQKKRILSKQMRKATPLGDEVVVKVDKEYADLIDEEDAGKTFRKATVKPEKIGELGLIVCNPDDTIRVDRRMSTILAELEEELKPQLQKRLFAGTR